MKGRLVYAKDDTQTREQLHKLLSDERFGYSAAKLVCLQPVTPDLLADLLMKEKVAAAFSDSYIAREDIQTVRGRLFHLDGWYDSEEEIIPEFMARASFRINVDQEPKLYELRGQLVWAVSQLKGHEPAQNPRWDRHDGIV